MKFLTILRTVINLMPVLIQAIKAAEEAIPGSGKGEQKLAMVRGVLEAAYGVATDTEATFDEVWPAVQKAIASIVSALNAAGMFKK